MGANSLGHGTKGASAQAVHPKGKDFLRYARKDAGIRSFGHTESIK